MKLEQFLVKAKKNACASGEGSEAILADGCKELTFQEDGFYYRDRYFGWNPFGGEEVALQGGKCRNRHEPTRSRAVFRSLGREL